MLTLLVNMFHPDLRNGKIKNAVIKSLLNIKFCREEIRQEIFLYSKFIYCYWIFLYIITMTAYLSFIVQYPEDYSILKCFLSPMKGFSLIFSQFFVRFVILLSSLVLGYSLMVPVTIGIYVTFHEWVQFHLLNDYLKTQMWQKRDSDDLVSEAEQRMIYTKIRKIVQWHLHLKRFAYPFITYCICQF